MTTPLWLYACQGWHLAVYAVLMLGLDLLVVWAVLLPVRGLHDRGAEVSRCWRLTYFFGLVAQAIGIVGTLLFVLNGGETLVAGLRAAAYSDFDIFRIPLIAYLLGVGVMYLVGRFATFARVADDLTCRVAAAVTALVSAPWVLLIPASL
ncbi:MAG: hypothetical protein J6X61_05950 [Clostridia bacterium]|nr:hypothetical protein [Clostridia bacterium]